MRCVMYWSQVIFETSTSTWALACEVSSPAPTSPAKMYFVMRMWALLLAGGGVGFVGLAFVLTSIHHWLTNPDRNVTLVLIPIGLTSILLGIALLIVTTAIYVLSRNRVRTSGEGFSSAHGG